MSIVCPRCSFRNAPTQTHCSRCAFVLPRPGVHPHPAGHPTPHGHPTPAGHGARGPAPTFSAFLASVGNWFRGLLPQWVQVRGTVTNVTHDRMNPGFPWQNVLIGVIVFVVVGYVLLRVLLPLLLKMVLGLFVLMLLPMIVASMLGGGGMRLPMGGGMFPRMGMPGQGCLYALMGPFSPFRRFGPRPQVMVHRVTLRERSTGRFVLVQIQGDFYGGTVETGHDIEVEGTERHGTIFFRRGLNHTLGLHGPTEIRVVNPRG